MTVFLRIVHFFSPRRLYGPILVLGLFFVLLDSSYAIEGDEVRRGGNAPKIFCQEQIFQFGQREASNPVRHTFTLQNRGDTDLIIHAIRPSCGCTSTEISHTIIPPQGSAALSTRLDLSGRIGSIRKSIVLESNDPESPVFTLSLEGLVTTQFQVIPPAITLRQGLSKGSASGAAQITTQGKPFSIIGIQSSDPSVYISTEASPDGRSHQITATLEKLPESAPQSFTVTLQTDNPSAPTIDIPAVVTLARKFIVAPAKIVLKIGTEPIKRTIIVKAGSPGEFSVSNIVVPEPGMVASTTKMGDFGYRIDLRSVVPSLELNGKSVQIQIDDGTLFEIPFLYEK